MTATSAPYREDQGDLIVLYLYGSYAEMGRQQAELLGEVGREVYTLQHRDWRNLVVQLGLGASALDLLLPPFWSVAGPRYDHSGLYEELNGFGEGLRVSGGEAWRGVFGALGGGSTMFLATRSATADGGALVAKNADWGDGGGRRRPVVTLFHPNNGDLAHITAGWPLQAIPGLGVNEAGLAVATTFFNSDQVLALPFPAWPLRRALQSARTVPEALRFFREARNIGMAVFAAFADASGALGLVECTPYHCEVIDLDADWLVQTNHARTPAMRSHDRGRSPDSERRMAAAEAAVRGRLGRLDPRLAAEVLRDRSNSPYVNDSVVGNPGVLNSGIIDPRARTLWHSTRLQPQAPFGPMVGFSLADGESAVLEAAPLASLPREAAVIAALREALKLFDEGRVEAAGAALDQLAATGERLLQPDRLAWARARVGWTQGRLGAASELLVAIDCGRSPIEVCLYATAVRGLIADRQGDRTAATTLYAQTLARLAELPDYSTSAVFDPLRQWLADGLKTAQSGPMPSSPDLQAVPR